MSGSDDSHSDVDGSTATVPGKKDKAPRFKWSEADSMAALRLFRVNDGHRISKKDRGVLWRTIFKAMKEGGHKIASERSVRDHVDKVLKTFRAENPKLERITGDPEEKGFTEKHILLLDICLLEDEHKRYQDGLKGTKSLADEKRDRAEKKMMIAANHGRKKRGEMADDGNGEGTTEGNTVTPLKSARATWQRSIGSFFDAKADEKAKMFKLEEEKLAFEREKLAVEKEKLTLENLKHLEAAKEGEANRERQAKDAEANRENMKFMQQLMAKLVEKQPNLL